MSVSRKSYAFSNWVKPAHVPKLTRDNDVDLLRLILASCVVFFHSRTLIGGLDFAFARISAVPVFLFLSGLLITESFYGSANFKIYCEKRVRRIYPAYLAVVIFGGLLSYFGWQVWGEQSIRFTNLLKYWVINAGFANWLAPCVTTELTPSIDTCAVNGSLWVMKWEVIFYTALPAMLLLFSRFNKFFNLLSLLILTFLVSFETSTYMRIFQCFLMGICTYYLKPLWMKPLQSLPPIPPLLRMLILIVVFPLGQFMYYGPFILLLMLVAFYPTKEGWRLNTLKFGDISYGVFLIHFPLITGAFQFLPPSLLGPWVSLAVLFAAVILSILLYKFVEKPFLLPSSHYRKSA